MKNIKFLSKIIDNYNKKNKTHKPLSGNGISLQVVVFFLIAIGMLMVFSSSIDRSLDRYGSAYYIIFRQLMWLVPGAIGFILFYKFIDYRWLQKNTKWILLASIVLLVAVLLKGDVHLGAKRWLHIFGPISIQPSEFAKLAIIIALADFIDRKKSKLNKLTSLFPLGLIVALPLALIFLERDLGTPILISLVVLSMLFAGGLGWLKIALMGIATCPVVVYAVLSKPYRLKRVQDYVNSIFNIDMASDQVKNSFLTLGSGGIIGKGPGNSNMKDLWLSESQTDFIFSVIGEEWGFIGAMIVLGLFVWFFISGWAISKKSDTYFGSMLALGITVLITYQALINIGVVTGILPAKGIALPFISYGGSSLLINMIAAGILLNIAKNGK